jgi:hypothetical protein
VEFETYRVDEKSLDKVPQVTIDLRGNIILNASAFALLNKPTLVKLMFDPQRRIIGLGLSNDEGEGHPVRDYPGTPPRAAISATAFLDHYGVAHEKTKRWNAKLENDVLLLDLNTAPKEISRKRRSGETPKVNAEETPI